MAKGFCKDRLWAAMFLSAEATHLTAPVVLVTLLDVSPSAVQNMARHNRPLVDVNPSPTRNHNWPSKLTFQIPPEILSVDEALLLRFKSDDTINAKGFSAAYVVIDDADNFDYTPFETTVPVRHSFKRKTPRQKTL